MSLKIMCDNADEFTLIQEAVSVLEAENPEFMSYFSVAEEITGTKPGYISVLLKNTRKFNADLNRGRKYVIVVPESLIIDSFEFIKTFNRDPRPPRLPNTNVMMQAHLQEHTIDFLFLMNGFGNDNIRVVKPEQTGTVPSPVTPEEP